MTMNPDTVAEAIWRAHRNPRSHIEWADVSDTGQRLYRHLARAASDALGVDDPAWARPAS